MRACLVVVGVLLLGACGGGDGGGASTAEPAAGEDESRRSAEAYVARMRPIAASVGGLLRGAELRRNARDFDRGVALLRDRKRMARITADPFLLLAHDRLAKAVAAGGTILVANPGSEYARQARRAGTPVGTQAAVAAVAPALDAWAGETARRLRDVGAPVPGWVDRARRTGRSLTRESLQRLR